MWSWAMWSWDRRVAALAAAILAFDAAWTVWLAPALLHDAQIEASLVYETDGNTVEAFPGPQVRGRYAEEHTAHILNDDGATASVEFRTIVHSLTSNALYWDQSKVLSYDKHSLKVAGGAALLHFPPHVAKADHVVRMFSYIPDEGAVFRFAGHDRVAGLDTYLFTFDVAGLDWTDSYAYTLPAGTRIVSHDWGTVWIEPVSGIMVNHNERWLAAADGGPHHGMAVDEGSMWLAADTVTKQVFRAQNLRRAIMLYERVLPLALLGIGAIVAALSVRRLPVPPCGRIE